MTPVQLGSLLICGSQLFGPRRFRQPPKGRDCKGCSRHITKEEPCKNRKCPLYLKVINE